LLFEPPGPSTVAVKVVVEVVGHPPVPVQLFVFQLPVAKGETKSGLLVSIIPDPVRDRLHEVVVAWRDAVNEQDGGVNFGAVAEHVELPSFP
jgi:hypothetical protein